MPPFYVALCHIRPKAGLVEPIAERLAGLIKDGGGLIRRVNNSGIRPLPTTMKGKGVAESHKFASIISIEFVSNPPLAISATQDIRGLDDVIRINLLRADDILLKPPPRPSDAPRKTSRFDKPVYPPQNNRQNFRPAGRFDKNTPVTRIGGPATSRFDRTRADKVSTADKEVVEKPRISLIQEEIVRDEVTKTNGEVTKANAGEESKN